VPWFFCWSANPSAGETVENYLTAPRLDTLLNPLSSQMPRGLPRSLLSHTNQAPRLHSSSSVEIQHGPLPFIQALGSCHPKQALSSDVVPSLLRYPWALSCLICFLLLPLSPPPPPPPLNPPLKPTGCCAAVDANQKVISAEHVGRSSAFEACLCRCERKVRRIEPSRTML
jgi:hypothetical protein